MLITQGTGGTAFFKFLIQIAFLESESDNDQYDWREPFKAAVSHNGSCMYTMREIEKIIKENLNLEKNKEFDVLLFTQNPHGLIAFDGETATADIASLFRYPALTVPMGISEVDFKGERVNLPASAYFMAAPKKFSLMMSIAKRYEDVFWKPEMPSGFD